MARHLRFLVVLPALLMTSCFTWRGQSAGVTPEEAVRGIKDVATLSRQYENQHYFQSLAGLRDGRVNAWRRDLSSIVATIDRHLFNYSPNDPQVNYETNDSLLEATLKPVGSLAWRGAIPFEK